MKGVPEGLEDGLFLLVRNISLRLQQHFSLKDSVLVVNLRSSSAHQERAVTSQFFFASFWN